MNKTIHLRTFSLLIAVVMFGIPQALCAMNSKKPLDDFEGTIEFMHYNLTHTNTVTEKIGSKQEVVKKRNVTEYLVKKITNITSFSDPQKQIPSLLEQFKKLRATVAYRKITTEKDLADRLEKNSKQINASIDAMVTTSRISREQIAEVAKVLKAPKQLVAFISPPPKPTVTPTDPSIILFDDIHKGTFFEEGLLREYKPEDLGAKKKEHIENLINDYGKDWVELFARLRKELNMKNKGNYLRLVKELTLLPSDNKRSTADKLLDMLDHHLMIVGEKNINTPDNMLRNRCIAEALEPNLCKSIADGKITKKSILEHSVLSSIKVVSSDFSAEKVSIFSDHTDWVNSISWSPDGKMLASCSLDGIIIHTHNPKSDTFEKIKTLSGHTDSVKGISWSPDGTKLASCSNDKTVIIYAYDPQSHTFKNIQTLSDHTDWVKGISWSSDGKMLASCSFDRIIIHTHNPKSDTFEKIKTIDNYINTIISFNLDGIMLASCSGNNINIYKRKEVAASEHLAKKIEKIHTPKIDLFDKIYRNTPFEQKVRSLDDPDIEKIRTINILAKNLGDTWLTSFANFREKKECTKELAHYSLENLEKILKQYADNVVITDHICNVIKTVHAPKI
ncbi:MAG: PD40 domain-containing protein, partial [Candidatus Babeliaceae bacterium]|nr:PD40 domain-containing protein [Candidatus Babeliaceae bacterium]